MGAEALEKQHGREVDSPKPDGKHQDPGRLQPRPPVQRRDGRHHCRRLSHTVEGLEHEHEVVEFQDGDDKETHYRPGRQKAGRVKITRDFSATKEFFNWRKTVIDGKVSRKSVSIILLNDAGEEALRYKPVRVLADQVPRPRAQLAQQRARDRVDRAGLRRAGDEVRR